MSTVRSLDVAVRANTANFEGGMRKVSQALRATVAGLNFVTAAAASQEKSFLAMANAVAIGFAAGGPVGLAVAGLGVGLGAIIGKTKEAEEAWKSAMQSMRSETEALEKTAKATADKLFELQGGDILARSIEEATVELDKAVAKRDAAMARAQAAGTPGIWDSIAPDFLQTDAGGASDDLKKAMDEAEQRYKQLNALRSTFDSRAQIQGIEASAEALKKVKDAATETGFAVQFAARSLSDLIAGVIVDGAKAVDVLRSIGRTAASIGIQRGVNAAFGLATP